MTLLVDSAIRYKYNTTAWRKVDTVAGLQWRCNETSLYICMCIKQSVRILLQTFGNDTWSVRNWVDPTVKQHCLRSVNDVPVACVNANRLLRWTKGDYACLCKLALLLTWRSKWWGLLPNTVVYHTLFKFSLVVRYISFHLDVLVYSNVQLLSII